MHTHEQVQHLGYELYRETLRAKSKLPGVCSLRAVTLTASREVSFLDALTQLATSLDDEAELEGYLLSLDVGEDPDHLHAHGLVLAELGTWKLKNLWASISQRGRNTVRTLSPRRHNFEESALRVCQYCVKPVATAPSLSLEERVITGGIFRGIWTTTLAHSSGIEGLL